MHQKPESTSSWLFSHVEEFHSGLEAETIEHGWHLHFIYFGEENSDLPRNSKVPAQHYFIVGESSQSLPVSESAQTAFIQQVFASNNLNTISTPPHIALRYPQDRASGEHFLQSYQSKSLRDLTSVSLC